MAINCSARESHYSDRHFFCNIFFGFVSVQIKVEFFCVRSIYKPSFRECKQLKYDRIHDRITHIFKIGFMSLLSQTRRRDCGKSLANSTCVRSPKKRSPSVSRKNFVFVLMVPQLVDRSPKDKTRRLIDSPHAPFLASSSQRFTDGPCEKNCLR
jgi:hypothetical protein